ncbi:hypothetical protein GN958_ATG23491 [Phytophthora infestans]|uniref:Secreted RxLR effector peptide protein n=1 Tax=Phytophthora infestans TaxID=4787 RepID=A0A8S9TIW9_PHYIN|nr:hypothetical protein GN958_ATG23491 [Phytophthora infestans]
MTRLYLLILAALAIFADPSAAFGVAKMGVIKSTSDHLKAGSDSTTLVKTSVNAPGSQVDDERTLSAYLSTLDDAIKRSKAVDNVFKVLNLNRASDDLLTNANWVSWEKYVEELFPKNFKDEVLVKTLREHYDDQHILQMLAKAKENPRTKEIATALEKQLINIPLVMLTSWKGRNLGPGHVFKVFPVKDSSQLDDLVRDKKWGFWIKYVDGITPDADKVSRILNPLINRFTTEGVVKAIASDSVVEPKTAATFFRFARLRGALSACGLLPPDMMTQSKACMAQLRSLEMDTSVHKDGEKDTSSDDTVKLAETILKRVNLDLSASSKQ